MTKQHMPGGMGESPAKGEPTKKTPKNLKNAFDLMPKPPPESHSEEALGEKYGAGENAGRTRSGDLKGLDRPGMGGDRPTEGSGGTSVSVAEGPAQGLDQSGKPDGDQPKDLDRPAEPGGDRSEKEGEEITPPSEEKDGIGTTPDPNTSDVSDREIEQLLSNNPEIPNKGDERIPENMSKNDAPEGPSNVTKGSENPSTNYFPSFMDQSAKELEDETEQWFLKRERWREGMAMERERQKELALSRLRSDGTPNNPPDAREYETRPVYPVLSKQNGDAWSEQGFDFVRKRTRRGDGCMIYEVDKDVDGARSKILDMDPGLDYDINRKVLRARERMERADPIISLSAITHNDEVTVGGDDDYEATAVINHDRDNGYRMPIIKDYRDDGYGLGSRQTAINTLSKSNASTRIDPPGTRPMSEVRISYGRDITMPEGLADSISSGFRRESKGKGPATSQYTAASSISRYANNNFASSSKSVQFKWNTDESEPQDNGNNVYYNRGRGTHRGNSPGSSSSSSSSSSPIRPGRGVPNPRRPNRSQGSRRSGSRRRRNHSDDGWDENVKMKMPGTYDGSTDMDVFDSWVYSITNYANVMRIRETTMIRIMADLVAGKAAKFFKSYVANKEDEWTFGTIFPAIFDYCFPKDFMKTLRKRWDNIKQGKRSIREYVIEIEELARKFREINERTVVLKFWNGLNSEIKQLLALLSVSPETYDLDEIIRKAEDAEKSIGERDYERGLLTENRAPKKQREWTRFKNRTGGAVHFKPGQREKDEKPAPQFNRNQKVRANAISPKPQNVPEQKPRQNQFQKTHSRAKLDALRAEGKCFNCQQTGHEQRNCPRLNSMRPPKPTIRAGAINLARMDQIAERKEQADIFIGHVSIREDDPMVTELEEFEEVEYRVHQMCEATWGEDPLWYNEETRPDCRWSVGADEDEITVWNFQNGGSRTFPRDAIDDPSFDIAEIFAMPEPIRPPTSVREGGYPDLGDYQRWEWPAINWLHARLSGQLEFADEGNAPNGLSNEHRIDIQPTMWGYSVQLDESDIIYHLTHEDVLDKRFSPEAVINQLIEARSTPAEQRGEKFEDKRLTSYVMLMLGMTTIPGQKNKIKKRGNQKRVADPEGVPAVERTSMRVKDKTRRTPECIVVPVKINGQVIRALLDSGSMADFISTTVADQLRLPKVTYQKPLSVQLAVHGSRSKINCGTTVRFQYQTIDCEKTFDIANLDNYDAILGTPFLYQHQVAIGFNPSRVIVGSSEPIEMKGPEVTTITSAAADLLNEGLDQVRAQLRHEAEDLCLDTSKTSLPPFRAVNHTIPLIDDTKIYRFRPSKCPEAFRDQWRRKKNAYLETGRWRTATGHNAIPLLMIPKMSTSNGQPTLRTVFDKREQNANTHKLASPLPDIEEILREVSRHKYRSLIDGKDAYEQIRVVDEHVPRTIFTTPDGTMESLVMQQGDCNAGATYQTLMNHIFASYLGVFVYVYLDDIIIFSDSISDHVKHVRIVFDILRKEKLYLGPSKMQFFAEELKILGHIIDDRGISMDPHKVDKVLNWKAPSNKDLLRSFIGAVGFLAPDCKGIRIPMGHLSGMTAESRPWRWDDTAQRAFDEVKKIVNDHRDQRREALDYSKNAPPIWVTTDGCLTGGGGYVSQGNDPNNAKIVGFWSGKWSSAQQNYPVHEQELLALVETLKRFRGILHGTSFTVRTDHKGLTFLKTQRDLSHRQLRWLDVLNEFDYDVEYIPGETNEFADALSRIYSDEKEGVIRAESEYVTDIDEPIRGFRPKTHPIYIDAALMSIMSAEVRRSSRLADKPEIDYSETQRRREMTEWDEDSPTVVQEFPGEGTKDDELDKDAVEDDSEEVHHTERLLEDAEKLFRTIGEQNEEFPECLKGRYEQDPMFKPILDNPENYTNFEIRNGLIFFKSEGMTRLAVPDVKINDRSIREAIIRQGHSILAHLGGHKTLTYLRDQVWWKTMVKDVTDYCQSCQTCATSKSPTEKHWGQGVTYLVGKWWVCVEFVL